MTNKLSIFSGTVTGPGTQAGVPVGTITGDWTAKLLVKSFPIGSARIIVEESVDNTFANPRPLCVFNVLGGFNSVEGVASSSKKRDAAGSDLVGTSGAYLRANVEVLYSSLPNMTYTLTLEY